jgi:hypothetical protein
LRRPDADGKIDAGEIRHRRSDDRQLDAEQLKQSPVGPGHGT